MKTQMLLPNKCRIAGCILLPLAIALLIAYYNFDYSIGFLRYHVAKAVPVDYVFSGTQDYIFSKNFAADYTGTVGMIAAFASLFMIAFSKEKQEDEYVRYVRLNALQISVYANYIILALAALLLFGFSFLMVMELNLFTILILFIITYQYQLRIKPRLSKTRTA